MLDFGGLAIGDPAVDLAVAWEVVDAPARDVFRSKLGVDDAASRNYRPHADPDGPGMRTREE